MGTVGASVLFGIPPHAEAQVTGYNIFEEDFLVQTGPATVTSNTWVYTANLSVTNPSDVATATVTAPSNAVYNLSPVSTGSTNEAYRQNFATKSAMNNAFPTGASYTFAVSGGTTGSESGVLDVPSETTLPYPSAIPSFSNYSAFQNLDPARDATFSFSGFQDITGGSKVSELFFVVTNASTGATVFSENFLPASTTSIVVSAGTLSPGTTYTADLDYSNRDTSSSTGFDGVTPFTGFDYNTSANFTTALAVPEPSNWAVMGLGSAGMLGLTLRRRAARV